MHEFAITRNMLDAAVEESLQAGGRAVRNIFLAVGPVSPVAGESVKRCFDFLSRGTVAEGARLVFRNIPAEFECKCCGAVVVHSGHGQGLCAECGGEAAMAGTCSGFYIENIELF